MMAKSWKNIKHFHKILACYHAAQDRMGITCQINSPDVPTFDALELSARLKSYG